MRTLAAFVLGCVCLGLSPVQAQDHVAEATALSGDQIALSDGTVLRLSGIKAATPEAANVLAGALRGRTLVLGEASVDRFGRRVAVASVDGAIGSLQDLLLREGHAFVYPAAGGDEVDAWLVLERESRAAKRGLWSSRADAVPSDASKLCGQYAFIAGEVAKAVRIKNKVYITFGSDAAPDFTLVIAARHLRTLKKRDADPLALQGRVLRVRGSIQCVPAPQLTLSDPHQLEVLR